MIHYALFFSTKKKACQEKTYRTEVVFEDKIFQFLSSKTTSVLKNPSKGRILSVTMSANRATKPKAWKTVPSESEICYAPFFTEGGESEKMSLGKS